MSVRLIYDRMHEGRRGVKIPRCDVPEAKPLDSKLLRKEAAHLPEVSELDVVRHFTNLSRMNFSIDSNYYPLGSCTMKYNPKIQEKVAALEGFSGLHPNFIMNRDEESIQGALEVVHKVSEALKEITGMDEVTVTPQAGAHGEMLGLMLIARYHQDKGNDKKYVIVPDSSHGTNPATANMVGYEVITIKTSENGDMDLAEFKSRMNQDVAAVMMTAPNTLGIFNPEIKEICDYAHANGALVYYDGANLNAILGKVRPGDIGFDVVHVNLHKTFATPHGGGGPGSGPVGVKSHLIPFLTNLQVKKNETTYELAEVSEKSVGRISPYFGNFGIVLRAYAYMLMLGKEGLLDVSEKAVLNANYIMQKLKPHYDLPYDMTCMHECVFSAEKQAAKGVKALDIAKFLIDKGMHAPTVYFPLIVKEAMMIEPTETESKETIDLFIEAMIEAAGLAESDPEAFKEMPKSTPVCRLDETKAAREIDIRWKPE